MLKSAKEVAQLAQEARAVLRALSDQEHHSVRLNQVERQNFEQVAAVAAMSGKGSIVVSQLPFGQSKLQQLGFLVEKLERQPERLIFLEKTCSEARAALQDHIGRIHDETPLIQTILRDASLQSSSFIPFLEWLWQEGQLKDVNNVDVLLEKLKSYDGVDVNWVERKRPEFARCLELFFRLKLGDTKLAHLRTRTQLIPNGEHSAYLVSWEGSEDGGGNVIKFSAQTLKWLSVHWTNLSAILNARFVAAAEEGITVYGLDLEFDGRVWLLDDGSNRDFGVSYGIEACSPHLIEAQLAQCGYKVLAQSLDFDDDDSDVTLTQLDLHKTPPKEGDLCRLTVQWP